MGRRLALSLLGYATLPLSALSLPAMAQERIISIGPATTKLILALGARAT